MNEENVGKNILINSIRNFEGEVRNDREKLKKFETEIFLGNPSHFLYPYKTIRPY